MFCFFIFIHRTHRIINSDQNTTQNSRKRFNLISLFHAELPRLSRKFPFFLQDHIRTSKVFFRVNFVGHVRSRRRVKPSVNQYYGICMLFTREPPSTFVWIIPEINQCPFCGPLRLPLAIIESKLRGKQINGPSLSTLCAATSFEKRRARIFGELRFIYPL